MVPLEYKKGKVLPYSLPIVGPGDDPGVQTVGPRRWLEAIHPAVGCHYIPPVTFPAEERHRPSAGTKLYCLVTEAHACEQLAQGCYLEADRPRFQPATFRIASEHSTVKPRRPSLEYTGVTGPIFTISIGKHMGGHDQSDLFGIAQGTLQCWPILARIGENWHTAPSFYACHNGREDRNMDARLTPPMTLLRLIKIWRTLVQ